MDASIFDSVLRHTRRSGALEKREENIRVHFWPNSPVDQGSPFGRPDPPDFFQARIKSGRPKFFIIPIPKILTPILKKSGDPIGIRTARPECRPLLLTSFKSSPLSVKELISRTSELIEFQSERFPISRATTSLRRRSTKIDNITPRIKNRIF